MKKPCIILSLLLASCLLQAQTLPTAAFESLTKTKASGDAGVLTAGFHVGTGTTTTWDSGSTLTISGVLAGTPTGGTLNLSALTLTLPSYGVPSGFTITGASSITLSAAASQNIALVTSGTGFVTTQRLSTPASGNFVLKVLDGDALDLQAQHFFGGADVSGSPTRTNATNKRFAITGVHYLAAEENFLIMRGESTSANNQILIGGGSSSFNAATSYIFYGAEDTTTTTGTSRVTIDIRGRFQVAAADRSTGASWGTTGIAFDARASTITNTVSSGTVATAVMSSFSIPTFAASSSTTFTNAANVYIAGDVAAGTNVTLTNSYGLWNLGKTRLDGVTSITNNTSASSLTSGALQVTGGISSQGEVYGLSLSALNASGAAFIRATSANGSDAQMTLSQSGQRTWRWRIPGGTTNMVLTDASGSVDAATVVATTGNWSLLGDLTVSGGDLTLAGTSTITGGAGNMTITAGTGASRTLTLQTTTSGSAATTALQILDDQSLRLPSTNTAGIILHNNATIGTNDEMLRIRWLSNTANIFATAGTGGSARSISLGAQAAGGFGNSFTANGNQSSTVSKWLFSNFGGSWNASSGNQSFFEVSPSFASQSGTAGWDGVFVNVTDGSGSGAKNLIRAALASADKFSVSSTGAITSAATITTAAGVAWNLGAYTGGAPTPDGYLTVTVAGATYRISADLQ